MTPARSTKETPSSKSRASGFATAAARDVLPTPPVPSASAGERPTASAGREQTDVLVTAPQRPGHRR